VEGERLKDYRQPLAAFRRRTQQQHLESLCNNANVGYALQQTSDPSNPSVNPGSAIASFLLNVPDSAGRRNVRNHPLEA
jgi:hypothetical protein